MIMERVRIEYNVQTGEVQKLPLTDEEIADMDRRHAELVAKSLLPPQGKE